jgi:superfamily I DNA/RNA helicase
VLKAAVPLIASQAERFGEDLVLPTAEGEPGPPVQLHLASDEESEATWIADRIRHHILDDVHPANIAVLANTRSARALLRKHLERRDIDVESYDGGGAKRPLDLDHPSVKLLSVSSAKGIEFPIVFVAGATERNYPSAAANPEAIDHAKRMLYTAITRAGRLAHISAPQRDATQLLLDLNLEYAT